ncbi:hypothetical protein OKW21_006069 [Catalinimonas alkaloidigena]|uniref:hypothetical protein n=1 Tax=Catalinimonas alkaloidigena TaxID=1075417 RepID=UPI00240733D1|nr:hypothetical protein [Catalinimonas alkaloidigena]MDF9800806.1 hypothetical protein [Catalinimonas alkaloidigena]
MQISFNNDFYFFAQRDIINFLNQSLPDNLKPYKDRFLYPIHLLNVNRILSTKYEHYDYIPLMSELLQDMLGSSKLKSFDNKKPYSFILNYLKDNGIIEQDTNVKYIPGKRAKAYRITEQYRYCQIRQIEIVDDYMFSKVVKWKDNLFDSSIPYLAANRMNLNSLSIDANAATKFLEKKYSISVDDYLSGELTNQVRIDKDLADRYGKFEQQYAAVNKIYFLPDFSRSKANNRVHTSLTSLSKSLRQFLYLPDEKARLFSIDCRNSQPLIFNVLIKQFADRQGIEIDGDLLLYKNLTEGGRFYEYIADKVGYKLTDDNRSEFKKKCFSSIFYNEFYSKGGGKIEMIFQKLFPTVYKVLEYHKTSGTSRKEGPRNLALNMQKAEANIFIDIVCNLLLDHDKSMFFTTIHDSVICLEHHIEVVKNAIKKAFSEYNIVPSLSTEVISDNHNPEEIEDKIWRVKDIVPAETVAKFNEKPSDGIVPVESKKSFIDKVKKYDVSDSEFKQLLIERLGECQDFIRRLTSDQDEYISGDEKFAMKQAFINLRAPVDEVEEFKKQKELAVA